jgi:WD40 repeat protein
MHTFAGTLSPRSTHMKMKTTASTLLSLLCLVTILLSSHAQQPDLAIETGHSDWVHSVALSGDGKLLASGSNDNTIKLWEVATGREIRTLRGHSAPVNSVVFSGDSKLLASGSNDRTIKLWEVATGREIRTLFGHSREVNTVALSADGKLLASGSDDNTIKLWEVATGREIRTLTGHSPGVSATPQQTSRGGQAREPSDGLIGTLVPLGDNSVLSSVHSVALSGDGKLLASGSNDNTIKLWEVATGRELRTLAGHSSWVSSVAFSADGKLLASGSDDNTIKLWEVATGREIRTLAGHSLVALSGDGRLLASGSGDKSIKLWEVATGRELRTLTGHSSWVSSVAFSADGKLLASGNGKVQASGSGNNSIKLWEVATGRELRTLTGHSEVVNSVAFSTDGKLLASGSNDNTIKLWPVATGRELRTLADHSSRVFAVALSADGKLQASASFDKIKLSEVATGRELRTLTGHSEVVHSVAFSSNGKLLASSSGDMKIKLWEVATGREIRTLSGHYGWVHSVAFSSDGKLLASASGDRSIKLWEVATGRELRTLTGHSAPVWSVAFSGDGKLLASGSADATTRLWNVGSGQELARLIALDTNDWAVVTPDGRFDASPGAMKLMHWNVGAESIALEQLKERYYEPRLLAKLMGFDQEPLRDVTAFKDVKLYPAVEYTAPAAGNTQLTIHLTNRGGGIGRVQVLLNGKELVADARPAAFDAQSRAATLTVDLKDAPLVPGQPNPIEVIARNAEEYLASPRGARLLWVPPLAAPAEPPQLYAIVGGISTYSSPHLNLRYAAKDASDFATAVRAGAARLLGAGQVHLALLTSDAAAASTFTTFAAGAMPPPVAPTKANFRLAFAAARQAKPTDILVIYLAGHGVALARGSDLYCYLTQEARSTDTTVLNDPALLGQTTITSEELTEWIKQIPALKQVMVLDTCAAGAAAARLTEQRALSSDQIRAIDRLKDRTGFHVLMGSAADASSYEATQYGQGLLTYSLLQGLKGAALREGEYADVSQLFQYAADQVPDLAKGVGGVQRPLVAAPQGTSFDVGRFSAAEKAQVPLAQLKPLLLRPLLLNPEEISDSLNLTLLLRQKLREASYVTARGEAEPAVVFVDADELPGALRPTGTYTVAGQMVTVKLVLRRDGQAVQTLQVQGSKDDPAALVARLTDAVIEALGKL